MMQETGDRLQELTTAELDVVSGGATSGISHFVNIAVGKIDGANSATMIAAQQQRERQSRYQSLRTAMTKIFELTD